MGPDLWTLLGVAATVGVVHTLAGPDHYIPFIALARARGWSLPRTLVVTGACGVGHVLGSIVLGALGIALGAALGSIEAIEGARGELAGWAMIALGGVYALWGLYHALGAPHAHHHPHVHADGTVHTHDHAHPGQHAHDDASGHTLTFWALFIVFALGPCEVLIPTLMVPAMAHDWTGVAIVSAVFGVATVTTMLSVVTLATLGLARVRLPGAERWAHVAAGLAIVAGGLAVNLLGL